MWNPPSVGLMLTSFTTGGMKEKIMGKVEGALGKGNSGGNSGAGGYGGDSGSGGDGGNY